MIALLVISLLQAAAEPEVGDGVDCIVIDELAGRRLTHIWFECPDDVIDASGLQAYADRVAGQLQLPFNLQRLRPTSVNRQVTFHRDGLDWGLSEPVIFITSNATYPRRALAEAIEANCSARYWITPEGRAEDIQTRCVNYYYRDDSSAPGADFEGALLTSIRRWRWFVPVDAERHCDTAITSHLVGRHIALRPWLDNPNQQRDWLDATVEGALQCP